MKAQRQKIGSIYLQVQSRKTTEGQVELLQQCISTCAMQVRWCTGSDAPPPRSGKSRKGKAELLGGGKQSLPSENHRRLQSQRQAVLSPQPGDSEGSPASLQSQSQSERCCVIGGTKTPGTMHASQASAGAWGPGRGEALSPCFL